MDRTAPIDKYNLILVILLIQGIGSLLPWNMFITANDYFVDYKLNVTTADGQPSAYTKYFLSYVGDASKIPNIIFQALNLATENRFCSLTFRIFACIIIEMVIFGATVALALVDTDTWVELFFIITMISIVIINMANGIFQSCMYAVAAKLPEKYTNTVTTGINISGIFAALAMIISIATSSTPKIQAVFYFSTSILYLIISFVTYIFVPNNPFFAYYQRLKHNEVESNYEPEAKTSLEVTDNNDNEETATKDEPAGFREWIKNTRGCWMQCINIFIIYFVSLSIFPALQANIEPLSGIIGAAYFKPVFCFLSFNLFSMIGNLIAGKVQLFSKQILWVPSLARVVFFPFFLFCNYNPNQRTLGVIFDDDYAYIVISVLFALSNGYLSSLAIMYAPKSVEPRYSPSASMMASVCIILGILAGVNFSFLFPSIVKL